MRENISKWKRCKGKGRIIDIKTKNEIPIL
jgi:hypothetical protein